MTSVRGRAGMVMAVLLLLTVTGCSSYGPEGCLPGSLTTTTAEVEPGEALSLRQRPGSCRLDLEDGDEIVVQVGSGSPLSRPYIRKAFKVKADGSFAGVIMIPEDFPRGPAYAVAIGGYDPHSSGDLNLPALRFQVAPG